jgi:hypothetical protein
MMDEKFTFWEKKDSGKNELPATILSALEDTDPVRKCLMKLMSRIMMAALSSIENEVYRIQHEAKQQQLTLMDMWKKLTTLYF